MAASPGTLTGCWSGLQETPGGTSGLIHLLDAIDVPVLVLQRGFLIACFNRAAAELLGLSAADLGRPARDLAAFAGSPRLEARCRQAIVDETVTRADFRAGEKWFAVRISPHRPEDREIVGTVLTFTNVTALRASIDQAVYEREFIKAIINTVVDPLVVLSDDQRVQSGNRAFYALFGVSRQEMQGQPLSGLGEGALARASLRKHLAVLLAGEQTFQPVEVDGVATVQGRRTLILDARLLVFPGHPERRVLVTFQDITARKQAEAAKDLRTEAELRRSESFLAEGQRLSLTGTFSWKLASNEIIWSEQLYRIYGFEPGTLLTLERINSRVHPEDLPLMDERIARVRAGVADFEHPHRLLMDDGSLKYVNAIAHGIVDSAGQLEYVGAVQDVTQRRLSEAALAKARAELAKVARVSSLGVLTASIAHEVNQPLSGIITNASTCLRMLSANPPNLEGARETARRTIRDGNRASDVIKRLRTLYTRKDPLPEAMDLNDAAREVTSLSLSELQGNRVTLRHELAEDLPPVSADRIQLQQVILNLVRNASEAMSAVDDRPRVLVIRTAREGGDQVRLSVSDSGPGVAEAAFDKLFEAFYTTKADGMGIGLSVSRSIIEAHHGRLWAAAHDGPGTTFSFVIPCRQTTAAT